MPYEGGGIRENDTRNMPKKIAFYQFYRIGMLSHAAQHATKRGQFL